MKKIVSVLLTLAMLATMASVAFAVPVSIGAVTLEHGGTAVSKILGAIQWIGYAFAIGMLIYIGIKYTMSAANEKADLKKSLTLRCINLYSVDNRLIYIIIYKH